MLSKADGVEKIEVEASVDESVSFVYKNDDQFFIWGPASVEVVDKENDKIRVEALEKALPQLLKRARLSYAHTDQIVGKILESFETSEPVEVLIDGETFTRSTFPTDVMDLDTMQNEALYVAGEVYSDTEQSRNVRSKIEEQEIDSYSISGEALVTRKQVEGDTVYDDILELDLSAVTLCEEGMNQGAKFARVEGDIENVTVPESESVDKAYEVQRGPVQSPQQFRSEVRTMSKSDNPDDGGPNLSDDVAIKSLVKEQVEAQFEEQFEKHFDVHFASRAEDMVKNQVAQSVPDDVATKNYIDARIKGAMQDVLEREGEEHEGEEHEGDYEEVEGEEPEGDYEEVDGDGSEEDDEEMDAEMDAEEEDGGGKDAFTEAELKENLPSDVFNVVSEYLGTSKSVEEAAKSASDANQDTLQAQVEAVLSGTETAGTPDVGVGDREGEIDKMTDDEGDDEGVTESPALANFDHRN